MVKIQQDNVRDQEQIIKELEGTISHQEHVITEIEEATDDALNVVYASRAENS